MQVRVWFNNNRDRPGTPGVGPLPLVRAVQEGLDWPASELDYFKCHPGLTDLTIGVHADLTAEQVLDRFRALEWIDGMPNILRPTPAHVFARRHIDPRFIIKHERVLDAYSKLLVRDAKLDEDAMHYSRLMPLTSIWPDSEKRGHDSRTD
jgi:hypothetical protein